MGVCVHLSVSGSVVQQMGLERELTLCQQDAMLTFAIDVVVD